MTLILLLALPEKDWISFLASVLFVAYNFSTKDHFISPLKSKEYFECPCSKIEFARMMIFESIFFVADDILPRSWEYSLACLDTQCSSGPLPDWGLECTHTKSWPIDGKVWGVKRRQKWKGWNLKKMSNECYRWSWYKLGNNTLILVIRPTSPVFHLLCLVEEPPRSTNNSPTSRLEPRQWPDHHEWNCQL